MAPVTSHHRQISKGNPSAFCLTSEANLVDADMSEKGPHQQEQVDPKLTSLWQLLTKVQPGFPCHPEFQEYRQRNLQWRTGMAQGARGEVTDIGKEELGCGDFDRKETSCSSISDIGPRELARCASWPIFPTMPSQSPRKIWMLSVELDAALKVSHPRMWERLQSHAGLALQIVVLFLVVDTYAACPLTVSWAKVLGTGVDGLPVKGRPFKEGSVIIVSWALIAFVGVLLSLVTGGMRQVRECFDWRLICLFAPAGIAWALADVCEVLAVARIDPATYGVISQARLLGSAAACWMLRGMTQSRLQWGILVSLSLVCMAYCFLPDYTSTVPNSVRLLRWRLRNGALLTVKVRPKIQDSNGSSMEEQILGAVFALGKVALSVLGGVYGESCFKVSGKDGTTAPLHVQMTQVSFSSILAAASGYWIICSCQGEDPKEFFSGPDGSWTYRTLLVACMYCWREWICNLCVKRFDSLVKNICNAVSLVVTYSFTVLITREKDFSALKVLLLVAIVMEVVNYCVTRRQPAVPAKAPAEEIPVAEYKQLAASRLPRNNSMELKGL
jgi:hypothetical protein